MPTNLPTPEHRPICPNHSIKMVWDEEYGMWYCEKCDLFWNEKQIQKRTEEITRHAKAFNPR